MTPSLPYCRIKIAGEAGDGIITAGDVVMKTAARLGYYCTSVKTFPSNIRGGYAQSLVTIAATPILSPIGDCTILFSLGAEAFLADTADLSGAECVLVESASCTTSEVQKRREEVVAAGSSVCAVPVVQLARETAGNSVIRSTVAIGVIARLLGMERGVVAHVLHDHFTSKGSEMVDLNLIAFNSGYLWAQQHLSQPVRKLPLPVLTNNNSTRVMLDGNQAVALGALRAGCAFYASYPITPATSIGEQLSRLFRKAGGFAYQAEDEIAALGSVVGASFSGVKAMTATSGPGLSLMQEFIGYASMVELPVVIVDVQRAGPSTGMPTKHSQDDVWAAVYGGHGEGPRVVVAPQSVTDCYFCTIDAFNAAEKYQCPVLLLSDSTLSSSREVIEKEKLGAVTLIDRISPSASDCSGVEPFRRYAPVGETGTGCLPKPGVEGFTYCATGIEHNDDSTPAAFPDIRTRQMERRFAKMASIERQFVRSVVWDRDDAIDGVDVCVCSWGFTVAATAEAVALLRAKGITVAALYPRLLYPLCTDALKKWTQLSTTRIIVEANYSGQYTSLVRAEFPVAIHTLTMYRGEPFSPREIVEGVLRIVDVHKGES